MSRLSALTAVAGQAAFLAARDAGVDHETARLIRRAASANFKTHAPKCDSVERDTPPRGEVAILRDQRERLLVALEEATGETRTTLIRLWLTREPVEA